jgi:hypothetical protein
LITYAGSARRRGQVIAPNASTVSAALQLWLRSDSADLTALSEGGAVASWADQSGNNRNFAQGTANMRPTYRKTSNLTPRGLPCVEFAGGDSFGAGVGGDNMTYNALGGTISNAAGYTFYAHLNEVNLTSPGQDEQRLFTSSDISLEACSNTGTGWSQHDYVGLDSSSGKQTVAPAVTGWQVLVWVLSPGGTLRIYRNGAQIGANAAWSGSLTNAMNPDWSLGSNQSANICFMGRLAVFLIYNAAHDAATRAGIENYLSQTYG